MARRGQVESPSFPPVRVVSGPAFELIAELAAFASGPARPSLESGKTWIRDVRSLGGVILIEHVERWGFALYTELASIALDAGPPYEPAQLVDRLRTIPSDMLQRRLLGAESPPNRSMASDGAFDRALAGDAKARAELRGALGLYPQARRAIDRLLTTDPDEVQQQIAAIVEAWSSRVYPAFADDARAVIARDVAAKKRLFASLPGREALLAATNGIDLDPATWATDIVVIPTVALRPFIAPGEFGSTLIVLSSVADDAFEADASAPPRHLVKLTAALGDELRLRVLHILADEELTASEIADRLRVERTSLHHHLGILRSAGLVTMHDAGAQGWRYSRRDARVEDVTSALAAYLAPRP
jgi:DNA-binding transcriptional ArsR family regulator